MAKVAQARTFKPADLSAVSCLSFTADNRFLVSSHQAGGLVIWSLVDGELYKRYSTRHMIWHCFTPDNQFLLSIF